MGLHWPQAKNGRDIGGGLPFPLVPALIRTGGYGMHP